MGQFGLLVVPHQVSSLLFWLRKNMLFQPGSKLVKQVTLTFSAANAGIYEIKHFVIHVMESCLDYLAFIVPLS